jgi:hypothetical protein
MFIRLVKYLYFDPASTHNPDSHMFSYLCPFATRFLLILLKTKRTIEPKRLQLAYTVLTYCESLIKSIYQVSKKKDSLFLCAESIRTQKSETDDLRIAVSELVVATPLVAAAPKTSQGAATESQAIETDSLEKEQQKQREKDAMLVKQRRVESVQFGDLILESV